MQCSWPPANGVDGTNGYSGQLAHFSSLGSWRCSETSFSISSQLSSFSPEAIIWLRTSHRRFPSAVQGWQGGNLDPSAAGGISLVRFRIDFSSKNYSIIRQASHGPPLLWSAPRSYDRKSDPFQLLCPRKKAESDTMSWLSFGEWSSYSGICGLSIMVLGPPWKKSDFQNEIRCGGNKSQRQRIVWACHGMPLGTPCRARTINVPRCGRSASVRCGGGDIPRPRCRAVCVRWRPTRLRARFAR